MFLVAKLPHREKVLFKSQYAVSLYMKTVYSKLRMFFKKRNRILKRTTFKICCFIIYWTGTTLTERRNSTPYRIYSIDIPIVNLYYLVIRLSRKYSKLKQYKMLDMSSLIQLGLLPRGKVSLSDRASYNIRQLGETWLVFRVSVTRGWAD